MMKTVDDTTLQALPIPAFQNNYFWLLTRGQHAAIVDPGDALPVLQELQDRQLTLDAILVTHHHDDHTGGVQALLHHFPQAAVYAPGYTSPHEHYAFPHHAVSEPEIIEIPPLGLSLQVLDVPGHTLDHVAYYGANWLFCGDTLFGCGCGRTTDGDAGQLYDSLQKLARLPPETLVYCAHEYTLPNLHFARMLEPHNAALSDRELITAKCLEQGLPSVPFTLNGELATNPFLRCSQPELRLAIRQHVNFADKATDQEVFCYMRELKNHY